MMLVHTPPVPPSLHTLNTCHTYPSRQAQSPPPPVHIHIPRDCLHTCPKQHELPKVSLTPNNSLHIHTNPPSIRFSPHAHICTGFPHMQPGHSPLSPSLPLHICPNTRGHTPLSFATHIHGPHSPAPLQPPVLPESTFAHFPP